MELQAEDSMSRVAQRHHHAVVAPGVDDQLVRHRVARDAERVVAADIEARGQFDKEAIARVLDRARLAVTGRAARDGTAEHQSDRLMPEADAEDRDARAEFTHDVG